MPMPNHDQRPMPSRPPPGVPVLAAAVHPLCGRRRRRRRRRGTGSSGGSRRTARRHRRRHHPRHRALQGVPPRRRARHAERGRGRPQRGQGPSPRQAATARPAAAAAAKTPSRARRSKTFFHDGLPEGFEFKAPRGGRTPGRSGVGSGVIVDAAGIVLTNNHVVEGADEVTVELARRPRVQGRRDQDRPRERPGRGQAGDGRRICPTAKLGDSDKLEIGDWVIAIGNPFELETTVSAGIISGKGRELGSIRRAKFLQTDAAINPGNSGGPLSTSPARWSASTRRSPPTAAATRASASRSRSTSPSGSASQLIAKGTVERGYLGVSIGPLDARHGRQARRQGPQGRARQRRDAGHAGRRGGRAGARRDHGLRRPARRRPAVAAGGGGAVGHRQAPQAHRASRRQAG